MRTKRVMLFLIMILLIVTLFFLLTTPMEIVSKECTDDSDCVVFGETGNCNCGCYNKNHLPSGMGGECFCLAPKSCKCVNGKCESVFEEEINNFDECVKAGHPILESYPRQCKTPDDRTFTEEHCTKKETHEILTLSDAKQIAIDSECGEKGTLKETYVCNEHTGTYWIDLEVYDEAWEELEVSEEMCNPACVVNVVTREAEINWRCTGLID